MGELCPWCGVTTQGEGPATCSGRFACSQRKAFEDGQENGCLAARYAIDYEARARAIRAVVAAQWMSACMVGEWLRDQDGDDVAKASALRVAAEARDPDALILLGVVAHQIRPCLIMVDIENVDIAEYLSTAEQIVDGAA